MYFYLTFISVKQDKILLLHLNYIMNYITHYKGNEIKDKIEFEKRLFS